MMFFLFGGNIAVCKHRVCTAVMHLWYFDHTFAYISYIFRSGTDLILLLNLFFLFFFFSTVAKSPILHHFKSDWGEIWQECLTHKWSSTVIVLRWRPWRQPRHFALSFGECTYTHRLSSISAGLPASSWSIVHSYLLNLKINNNNTGSRSLVVQVIWVWNCGMRMAMFLWTSYVETEIDTPSVLCRSLKVSISQTISQLINR